MSTTQPRPTDDGGGPQPTEATDGEVREAVDVFEQGQTLPRRAFMRRTAAAGAAVAVAAGGGTIAASSGAEATGSTIIGAGWGASGIAQLVFGLDDREDEIAEAEADELHDEIYAYAVEREPDDEDALDSMSANVDLLSQEIRRNAAFVIAEEAAAGDDEADVIDAAEEEIASTVRNYQENHVQRWERNVTRVGNRYHMAVDESELDENDVFQLRATDGDTISPDSLHEDRFDEFEEMLDGEHTEEEEYVDGTSFELYALDETSESSSPLFNPTITGDHDEYHDGTVVNRLEAQERDGNGTAVLLDTERYSEVWADLENLYEDELEHVETLVDLLYDPIRDGDVDPHSIASGSAILEEAEDMEHWGHAAAVYRAIAMPEGRHPVVVEAEGVRLEGSLFWTLPSDDGLEVGETIDPSDTIGSIYMGAEVKAIDDDLGDDLDDEDNSTDDDDGDLDDLDDDQEGEAIPL